MGPKMSRSFDDDHIEDKVPETKVLQYSPYF